MVSKATALRRILMGMGVRALFYPWILRLACAWNVSAAKAVSCIWLGRVTMGSDPDSTSTLGDPKR